MKNENEPKDLIEKFTSQLRSIRRIADESTEFQPAILKQMTEVKKTAEEVLKHLENIKKEINEEVDARLLPFVAEVIDPMLQKTLQVKENMEETLQNPAQSTEKVVWIDQVAGLVQLFSSYKNKRDIEHRVVKVLAEKISHLIEKDLQLIHDYQDHSISSLDIEASQIVPLKETLSQNIEQPLKDLQELKKPENDLTLQQAGDWAAEVQEKRGDYFDTLLMKIDTILKEAGPFAEEIFDPALNAEILNEIAYMEKELKHIDQLLPNIDMGDPVEIDFLVSRLLSLKEHAEQLHEEAQTITQLQAQLRSIISDIAKVMDRLPRSNNLD